jgi:hypothetical protein
MMQPLHWFSKYGRALYSTASGLNAKISYIIGFEMATEGGLSGQAAHDYAKQFILSTTHSGGEYNRPFGFSKLGKAQSSVSVVYTLNNFTMATMHMASRLLKDAVGLTPGLSKAERIKATKAISTMLIGQSALAGAFGLPLAGAMMAIVENINQEPIRDDIRTALAEMSGNTEMGSMFADVAMRGFPTLLGVDAQSRFGLGSVLGFSEYQGFEATGFFGAAGSIVEHMYKGLTYAKQGEFAKATKSAVPQFLKRPIELAASNGKYLDEKGELLVDPNTAEQFAYLIGFRPKRFSDMRLIQRVNRQTDQFANKARRDALQEIANGFTEKSGRQLRAEIQKLQTEDPLFQYDDFDEIVNRLTDIVMEQQIPLDPMRSGSYASLPQREAFRRTFPNLGKPISESQRLQLKHFIKGQITGKPEKPSQHTARTAQMIDQFLARNPGTSVQTARATLGLR